MSGRFDPGSIRPGTRPCCVPALFPFLFLALASLAYGQVAQPTSPPVVTGGKTSPAAIDPAAPEVKVGPDDPVITIHGFCADPAQEGDACKTVITRAQFEKLTDSLQPDMSLSLRLNVANAYARNLRMSAAAEKRGLDKTPAFEEAMRYARMQLLSQDLNRALRAEANHITDADLEDYYKRNQSAYEQATVARIFVPHSRQITSTTKAQEQAQQEKAAVKAMAKVADDLRARAMKGEDPDQLQIAAYAEAGTPRTTVNTKMEGVRRATLPQQHETVFDLKPGDISEVFSDPDGAHFIYKVISKRLLTLDEVKPEIQAAISSERYRDSVKPFEGNVVFSDAYFIPPGKPSTPPQENRRPKRRRPPVQSDQTHE